MITDIDYDKLLRWLLPVRLRGVRMLAWLAALVAPVSDRLYPDFKAWEAKSWYDLKYQSGPVAYLEYVLNDKFDAAQKRIYIGPGSNVDNRIYVYLDSEEQPVWIYRDVEQEPVTLFMESELSSTSAGSYDFSINVPVGLPNEDATLRAVADKYKRDGKSYVIKYF